jgi:hypothetical protein
MARDSPTGRISRLQSLIDPARQLTNLAVQLVAVERRNNGKLKEVYRSRVFGGLWHKAKKRYVGPGKPVLIKVSKKQFRLITGEKLHRLVVAGRGSGKSHGLAVWALCKSLDKPFGSGQLFSPTFKKSDLLWRKLLDDLPTQKFLRPGKKGQRKVKRELIFLNGFRLGFETSVGEGVGRGEDNDFIAFDERQAIDQEVVAAALYTCRKRGGYEILQIGTPELGTDFHEEFERYTEDETCAVDHFTSYANPFANHEVFEWSKKTVDRQFYEQEVEAKWVSRSGRVYYMFSRELHVLKRSRREELLRADITAQVLKARFDVDADVAIGVDYPRTAVVCKFYEDTRHSGLYVVDEINLPSDATPWTLAHELKRRGYGRGVVFDDIGHGEHSSKSESRIMRSQGFEVVHGTKNPYVKDRVNSLAAKLGTVDDHISLQIDPSCPWLIKCFESQGKDDAGKPLKGKHGKGYDHPLDALGYLVWRMWPIRSLSEQERNRIEKEELRIAA